MPVMSASTSYLVIITYWCLHMYVWINIEYSNCRFIGGQTCSGIDDETRGIQLSYMNDASNGWIQIAYFSDTLLYTVSIAFTLS